MELDACTWTTRRRRRWLWVDQPDGDSSSVVVPPHRCREMKKAGVLAAYLAAAAGSVSVSVVAFNSDDNHSASMDAAAYSSSGTSRSEPRGVPPTSSSRRVGEEKFAPRFDGLRFIETLVTAHR